MCSSSISGPSSTSSGMKMSILHWHECVDLGMEYRRLNECVSELAKLRMADQKMDVVREALYSVRSQRLRRRHSR